MTSTDGRRRLLPDNPRTDAKRLLALAMQALGGSVARPKRALRFTDIPARRQRLLIPAGFSSVFCRVYLPEVMAPPPPIYVNFHGGGFVIRNPEQDDGLCRLLAARAGVVVVNVDYDVAPQSPFPAAPYQAYDVVQWLREFAWEYGWDADRLIVGGQSAGAMLALNTAYIAAERNARGPDGLVTLYGPYDLWKDDREKVALARFPRLQPWMTSAFTAAYAPDRETRRNPLLSPAAEFNADKVPDLPPTLQVTAALDLLAEEGRSFAARCAQRGLPIRHLVVDGADHMFTHHGDTTVARTTLATVVEHVTSVVQGLPAR